MKKWLIGLVSLLLLFLISIYVYIPGKIFVIKSISVNANQNGVYRFLSDDLNWKKWWPDPVFFQEGTSIVFQYGNYQFKKSKHLYNSFEIAIRKNKNIDSSLLRIFSISNDSIKIEWNLTINTGSNPFNKISNYFKAKELSKNLSVILIAMQKYIGNVKHIYGVDIRKELVNIEFLVSTKQVFTHYPSTPEIYEMINQIKKYIAKHEANEADNPMLHIIATDSLRFEVQVAIPVNKKLPDGEIFLSKKMLKKGNILVTEVTGGTKTADFAMKQMDIYVYDHQYNNIAIPFYSLITDRMNTPDTSKWVTRIYYPIM